MTFNTISELVKASDTLSHDCLDLSGKIVTYNQDEVKQEVFIQLFAMVILVDGMYHYFAELKPDGIFGRRVYELIMTSTKDLTNEDN